MAKALIVVSKVKELARHEGKRLCVSVCYTEELEKKVKSLIEESCKRAKLNGRTTVMGKDL